MSYALRAYCLLCNLYHEVLIGQRDAMANSPESEPRAEGLESRILLAAPADWTVMMYVNGDNDLEAWAVESLVKLEQVGSTANVNITVELDRSPGSADKDGYDTSHGDWADTRRGLVAKGTDPDNFATPLVSLGEKDMGNPATLRDFVTWSVTNYPAAHYALFIKDHGGGLAGISFDDTPGADGKQHGISVAGVSTALTQAGVHPDIIVADACTMGMTEVAYQWRNNASILVASEPSILAHWYPYGVYDNAMADLVASPGQSPVAFAQDIVAHMADETTQSPTVAAIDLTKMSDLAAQLDIFASQALALPDTWADISDSISQSNYYENLWYRDLGTFLDNVQTSVTDPSAGFLLTSALDARAALSSSLIALRSAPGEDATGLSIYLPNQGDRGDASYNGTNYSFLADTQWDEFLYQFDRRVVTQITTAGAREDITTGADGNLWYTFGSGVGRLTPKGVATPYALDDHEQGEVVSITKGPDGNVWFADSATAPGKSRVGRITPSGVFGEYSVALPSLSDITTGPDGNLWVAGSGGIAMVTPAGVVSVYGSADEVFGIAAGPDGNLWYTAAEPYDGRGPGDSGYYIIGRISTTGGYLAPFHTGFGLNPMPGAITAGPDGNMWFTEGVGDWNTMAGGIVKITPAGVMTTYSVDEHSHPRHITVGPDGNLWFTETLVDRIGKISTKGVFTSYADPQLWGTAPYGITAGPDGRIWFTEYNAGQVGYVNIPTELAVKIETAPGQSNPTNASPIVFTVTFTQPVDDFTDSDVVTEGTAPGTLIPMVTNPSGDNMTFNVTVIGMTGSGTVGIWIPKGVAHSYQGDANSGSPDDEPMVMYDVVPFTVSINQADGQVDPTSVPEIYFTVIFNKPARAFSTYDVTLSGTAPGTLIKTVTYRSDDNKTFTVAVTGMTAYGTVRATIPAGWETDAAGNRSQASTSFDNVVTYQPFAAPPPTVTVEQAAGQPDPTITPSVNFTAVFSSAVADFTAADITLSGTAPGATVALVTDTGDHKTYTVSVNGMTASGTVIASIDMGMVHDVWGQGNFASTSHDNTVTYALAGAPTVTVTPTAGVPNPTGFNAYFTVVFNRPVADFVASDLVLGGTAPGTKSWYIASSSGQMTYNIRVTGMTGGGTVTATVPAGVAHASTGEANEASGNPDNIVNYEYMRATEFAAPMGSYPQGIVAGPDGNIWFTEYYGNKIAKMTPGGQITEYAIGTTYPDRICVGPDGNLWFSTSGNVRTIGKITTAGVVTLYSSVTASGIYLEGITGGPDGNVWFATDNSIGRITPGGAVAQYSVSGGSTRGITSGPDGNVWFTSMFGHKIGRVTPTGTITYFSTGISPDSWLPGIVAGPDGNLWFTEQGPNRIGRITPTGTVSEFTVGFSSNSTPAQITVGSDGNLWYGGNSLVGRITTAGVITEFSVPHSPTGIAQGPDGKIWFTEPSYGYVARLDSSPALPVTIDQAATQADPTSAQPIHYTVVFGRAVTDFTADKLRFSGTAAGTPVGTITDSGDHMSFDVAVTGLTDSGTLVLSLASGAVHDDDGNASQNATSSDDVVDYILPDVTPPTVTIDQAAGQADSTNSLPIHFQALFSEPVLGFDLSDVSIGGSAAGGSAVVIDSGDHMTFDVWIANLTGDGTVTVTIPAGVAHDAAGNANLDSTSTDNVVAYDATAPTVTIDQAAGQADPTASSSINFTAVFDEPVFGFGVADVTLSGTAPAASVESVTDSGDHMTYTVVVSGMTDSGTVIATIPGGAAHDAAGNANAASSSADNLVSYNVPPLTVTVDQAAGQPDPTIDSPINFTVIFSEPVLDFGSDDIALSGTAPGALVGSVTDSGDHRAFTVAISGMTGSGTVIATIPDGLVHGAAGHANVASTSTDNQVAFVVRGSFSIVDGNLERAIRNQLANDGNGVDPATPLTEADMLKLTSLYAGLSDGITDLSGMEYATNLQALSLFTVGWIGAPNRVTDLSPILLLTHLKTLTLTGNPIGDAGLAQIAGMKWLVNLDVSDCGITSLAALAPTAPSDPSTGMPNLQNLAASRNVSLSDYWAVSTMASLQGLDLSSCNLSDTSPLHGLTNLTSLDFGYNPLTRLGEIATLTNVMDLYLRSDTSLTDLAGLANLTSLRMLLLDSAPVGQSQVDSIDWSVFLSLTTLSLPQTGLRDLSPLSHAPNVMSLYLQANRITDVSALTNMPQLVYCDLHNNHLRTLTTADWSQLTNLWTLNLRHNGIDTDPASADGQIIQSLTDRGVYVDASDQDYTFSVADANLEQAIRDQLANDGNGIDPGTPLSEADMLNLTSLGASNLGITDLSGLEFATNLQDLNVSGNPIGDAGLAVIVQLKSLTSLNISNCGITTLATLATTDPADAATGMPNLISLDVSSNSSLTDYWAVRTMPSLQSFTIGSCGISDTAPLNGLTNLTFLYVGFNSLTSLSDIATLSNLRALYVCYNPSLTDLNGLTNLTQLQILHLGNVPIGQSAAQSIDWSAFTSLLFLSLGGTGLTEISFLTLPPGDAAMPSLTTLDVQRNSLTNLDGVGAYQQLTDLWGGQNTISGINAVTGCSALRSLSLPYNQVSDLSPLAGLANLDNVTLSYNQVTSLAGGDWSALKLLRVLYLDHNAIHDLTPLSGHPYLNELYLAGNRISNLAPLSTLLNLRLVDLESNRVGTLATVDWSALAGLQYLYLSHNRINIDPASADVQIIQALTDRGVSVTTDPQDHVNTVPVVMIDPTSNANEGTPWTGSGSFTDPDDDVWSATVDYGDGTGANPLALTIDKTFSLSHSYATPGDYTITVAANDGLDGGTATAGVHVEPIVPHLISDPSLENAIRQQLGISASDPVTQADLESLIQLDASYRGITDLVGLEYATNLRTLQLSGNPLSDLTPILGLPLDTLSLNSTGIGTSGLAEIASHLTGLTHLEVQSCNIDDFSSLASLTSLQYLNINYNSNAAGLDAISGLTSLTVLYAANTGIPAEALAPLNALRELDVSSCGLSTLSFLQGKQLSLLNLRGNPIADISLLGTQGDLWWLGIDGMGLNQSDIAAVDWSGLANLYVFTFGTNPIGSLSFLTAMPQLSSVGAWDTGVSDISPLAGLTGIHYLVLGSNPITDLSALNSLVALGGLNINDCELTTLGQVQWSNLTGLSDVVAMHNHLSTYTGGADAQIIADLHARGISFYAPSQYVKFGDAAFEAEIRTVLNVPAPAVVASDDMMSLTSLDFSGKPITSLAGIEYAESLTFVDLRHTSLNLSPGSPERARVDLLLSRGVTVLFDINTAPVVSIVDQAAASGEGSVWSTTGSFSDPDADTWTGTVDYGDGSPVETLTIDTTTKTFTLSHRYDEAGDYTVTVMVDDGGDTSGSATMNVQIDPVAPSAALWNDGPVLEGQPITVQFAPTDPSHADEAIGFWYSFYFTGTPDAPGVGDIIDSRNPEAVFTYATPGTHAMIGRIKDWHGAYSQSTVDLRVLNVAPTITSVTGPANGWYRSGQNLDFTVNFSESVTVSGVPTIGLTIGSTSRTASYLSGSGGSSLVFRYTVQGGDNDADGIESASPVVLNGGTIQDAAGNGATLTFAAPITTGVLVDTTAPALPTSSINDGAVQRSMVKKLTLTFGEKVVLGTGAVTVKKSDGSDVPDTTLLVTNPSGDQRNYVLSFSGIAVVGGSLADGIYDLSVAAAGVQDLAGNALSGSFSQRFHRLYGDYDGNKTVNNGDYFWFKQTFNKSVGETGFLDLYDYDGNGTINNGDYFQFKKRFGVMYTY